MTTTGTAGTGLQTDVTGLAAHAGEHLGRTAWRALSQEQVNLFADLTEDHNPIHVDPDHARATPFGTTIVHGGDLTTDLSLRRPVAGDPNRLEVPR